MENLPPLPTGFDSIMQITRTEEFEIEAEGKAYKFELVMNLDITFDLETNEVIIDCREERIDNLS